MTWWQAEQACRGVDVGGHLASIKNSESANFVQYKLTTDWSLGDREDNHGVHIGKNVFSISLQIMQMPCIYYSIF